MQIQLIFNAFLQTVAQLSLFGPQVVGVAMGNGSTIRKCIRWISYSVFERPNMLFGVSSSVLRAVFIWYI